MANDAAASTVLLVSAQSLASVYLIGAVGYASVKFPSKNAPFLPAKAVGMISRFTFNVLLIPLIYTTTATSVSPQSFGEYWFVMVAALFVLAVSYLSATCLGYCIQIQDRQDFTALRIAATFPNIVALPILIFPSLCEYSILYNGVGEDNQNPAQRQAQCKAVSTTMIFCYFFIWSLVFWSLGYRQLIEAAQLKRRLAIESDEETIGSATSFAECSTDMCQTHEATEEDCEKGGQQRGQETKENEKKRETDQKHEDHQSSMSLSVWHALRHTLGSPGFLAMAFGFITGCIPPLHKALFQPGGVVRFFGAALESLGKAASPIGVVVVAASLVPPASQTPPSLHVASINAQSTVETCPDEKAPLLGNHGVLSDPINDPIFGPPQAQGSLLQRMSQSFRRNSTLWLQQARTISFPERSRLLLWFVLSRLIIAPAITVAAVAALDCGGFLAGQPVLAKLVVIINSSLPGALTVVVLLKANEQLADSAAAVASVYLPSYILSILSIAAWTSIGLWVSLPDEKGNSFC